MPNSRRVYIWTKTSGAFPTAASHWGKRMEKILENCPDMDRKPKGHLFLLHWTNPLSFSKQLRCSSYNWVSYHVWMYLLQSKPVWVSKLQGLYSICGLSSGSLELCSTPQSLGFSADTIGCLFLPTVLKCVDFFFFFFLDSYKFCEALWKSCEALWIPIDLPNLFYKFADILGWKVTIFTPWLTFNIF